MVFSSLLFLFIFMPIQLFAYKLCRTNRTRNRCLLIFSLLFYSWTGPQYLLLLLFMVLIHYVCSNMMERYRRYDKLFLVLGITGSLILLGYFKYAGMICRILRLAVGESIPILQVVLPVGISFYTFQLISYLVDVYRREVPAQTRYELLLLYASLYHQCIAGPIVRYQDVQEEILHRRMTPAQMSDGITRFSIGLAKKTLLANTCASLAASFALENTAAVAAADTVGIWMSNLMYMLQIYLDFSAYSDMAIGLGLMFGFHYKENFDYPYLADSITDFWRRWHMSLSSFFRDYVYIPLGGNRKGFARQVLNMFVVWALTGLWHGAHGNFVLWGLYYFVLLVIEKAGLLRTFDRLPWLISRVLRHVYTLVMVLFGWVLFRFSDAELLLVSLKGMFGGSSGGFCTMETWLLMENNILFLIAAVIACTPCMVYVVEWIQDKVRRLRRLRVVYGWIDSLVPVALVALSTIALVGNSFNPFLYFQF